MSSSKNLEFKQQSFLNKSNSQFIEEMYVRFIENDPELPDSWKRYFSDLNEDLNSVTKEITGPTWGPKKISIDLPNNHLKYAITWYSISISILFYFLYFRKTQ